MKKQIVWSVVAIVVLLLTSAPQWVDASPPAQEQELLTNPGFEGLNCPAQGWCPGNYTHDTFTGASYGEVMSPQGWVTFWSEGVNPVDGRNYGRPECLVIPYDHPFIGPPRRVRTGNYAVKQFGFFRSIDAGLYQRVTGLTAGGQVRFSAYGHAWSCGQSEPPLSCGDPHQMLMRVGIDPNGGTDPWSPNIVWASGYSYDEFRMIGPVEATVGEVGAVTVFIRATAKWPVQHNDVYWDDASLVYTTPPAPPTNTPPPPRPTNTPGPSPTPRDTPTPRPDGAVVHVVEPGDTLFALAIRYGVEVEQIERLNAGSIGANRMIWTGQELVISAPAAPPTSAPSPTPAGVAESEQTGEGETEDTPAGVVNPEVGSVCVAAFHDRNSDTFRQPDVEELLPNAQFTLSDASGLLGQYTTDGLSEPYCFTGLTPGTYRVTMQPPTGYAASGPAYMAVGLAGGSRMDVTLGALRGTGAEPDVEIERPAEGDDPGDGDLAPREGGGAASILRGIARVGGIALLLLAVGIGVVFFLSRRR